MITSTKIVQQLSRFFFASGATEMMKSYAELAVFFPAPPVDDWSTVEFSFNRLFVGPRALLAPPYASIYLDGDNTRLMSESTMNIRQLYELVGLVSPWLNKIPDDHVALELDALWQIESATETNDSPQLQDVHDYLLARLQFWIPLFSERVLSIADVHPAVIHVTETLNSVISNRFVTTTLPRVVSENS
jgi:TorA maturation chaperone TorD